MQKRKDLISSLVLIALGTGWILHGLQYPMGSTELPGPGLLPLISGGILILLSTQLLISALPAVGIMGKREAVVAIEGEKHEYGGPLLLLAAAVVYLFTLEWTGYTVNTFLLVLLGIRVMGGRGWAVPLLVAAGTAIITYLLFAVLLNVPLPQGQLVPMPFGER